MILKIETTKSSLIFSNVSNIYIKNFEVCQNQTNACCQTFILSCVCGAKFCPFDAQDYVGYPRPQFWFKDLAEEIENPMGSVGL